MKLQELIKKQIISKQINSLSNQEYKNICSSIGKEEIKDIFRDYAEAVKSIYD